MVVFVGLALLGLAVITGWLQRRNRGVSRPLQSTPGLPIENVADSAGPLAPDPSSFEQSSADLAFSIKQRTLDDARAIHLTSIKNRVYHFVGKSAVIRFERNEGSGLWRVWIDAGTYDHAVIRATWKTEIGAWRLLLRAALSPEFGGPWMATK